MSASFHFDEVGAFLPGTIGARGQRTFFLQVRAGGSVASFKLEKQQVAALAEYLADKLVDLPPVDVRSVPEPERLAEPVVAEWTVGAMGLDYVHEADRFVLMAEEIDTDTDTGTGTTEDDDDLGTLRITFHRGQASAFIAQARDLVEAGRPPCPYCGRPWEPADNFCPCYN